MYIYEDQTVIRGFTHLGSPYPKGFEEFNLALTSCMHADISMPTSKPKSCWKWEDNYYQRWIS